MRFPLIVATLFIGLTGCGALADGDGRTPGDDLGRFRVAATLEHSDCGPDALGTPGDWSFDIQLARDDGSLYWNQGGAAVEGTVAPDGKTFELASETLVDVIETSDEATGCTMLRRDHAAGVLDAADLDVRSFSGDLTYSFEASSGSDCSPLVGVAGGFAALPCAIRYQLSARRNLAPDDRQP